MKLENKNEVAYIEKLITVNRVTKVVKGGKKFSFAAFIVVGDGHGRVGFGKGKAREVSDAMAKASERAKKSMFKVPLRESRTLHHDTTGIFGSSRVVLRSAPAGTGLIVGGPMRAVFEALGMQDVVGKSLGSSNSINVVKATFDALRSVVSPKYVASKRGKKISEITSKRG